MARARRSVRSHPFIIRLLIFGFGSNIAETGAKKRSTFTDRQHKSGDG